MNTTLKTILMGLGGLALAIMLSLGAFALAGRSLSEPPTALLAPSPSTAGGSHPRHTATPEPPPSSPESSSPSAHPSAAASSDDHSTNGNGSSYDPPGDGGRSDDPPGDEHDGDDD
jgi:hypothetical protein